MIICRVTINGVESLKTDKREKIGQHLAARGLAATESGGVWTAEGHAIEVEAIELNADQKTAFLLDGVLP